MFHFLQRYKIGNLRAKIIILMMKFRHLFFISILALLVYACGSDDSDSTVNFDADAQSIIDNDSIVSFLSKFYYDEAVDSVKALVAGKTALINDVNLKTQSITENEVAYTLYYYLYAIGQPDLNLETGLPKENPTVVDSVFVNYYGQRIVTTDSLSDIFDSRTNQWLTLSGTIKGWSYGFTNFLSGKNEYMDGDTGPISYKDFGKGLLFIPSGLAYANTGSGAILANEPIMFNIDLLDIVEDTDMDRDGIPSIMEDIDGDGKPLNDDTDGDLIANLFDTDDDGDGVLTINEDANGDGDPTNDFSDPNNPDLPDYLNFNIR